MRVLCVNSGSSSLKLALFRGSVSNGPEELGRVIVERVGRGGPATAVDALGMGLLTLSERGAPAERIDVVAHRFVHGGSGPQHHAIVDPEVRDRLGSATGFAPLHVPAQLAALDATTERYVDVPAVVCLDTAFHASLPEVAWRLPLPDRATTGGLRRYGFHGLNVEHVVGVLGERLGRRSVVAHLGSGSSCTALLEGRSVATSMGVSPIGGVVMGTRPGDLDPGVLVHLLRAGEQAGTPVDAGTLEQLLSHESGLLALSGGRSDDIRDLERAEADGDARASLALEAYVRSVAGRIGAYAVELGGLDQVVFTGGIGEHAAAVRHRITERLTAVLTGVETVVVPADEERVMARVATRLVSEP